MIHEKIDIQVDYNKAGAIQDGYQPQLITYVMEESESMVTSHSRPAVIICPGGAYLMKSDREAEIVAMRYLGAGMQAFVLQYSVGPSRYPSSLLELAAAVAYVRSHAKEWYIDPDRIVVCGFSAGGHLAASLGTLWDEPLLEHILSGDYPIREGRKLWKPDGMILCYPVITMGEFTHEVSRNTLLGDDPAAPLIEETSLELRVSEKTVPAFIWHTEEDDTVPVENSLLMSVALRRHQIPFELHIYEKGCHGLSLCDDTTDDGCRTLVPDNQNWMDMALNWMRRIRG